MVSPSPLLTYLSLSHLLLLPFVAPCSWALSTSSALINPSISPLHLSISFPISTLFLSLLFPLLGLWFALHSSSSALIYPMPSLHPSAFSFLHSLLCCPSCPLTCIYYFSEVSVLVSSWIKTPNHVVSDSHQWIVNEETS